MKGYPAWFTKNLISVFLLLSFMTGVFLVPTLLEMRFELDVVWRLPNQYRTLTVAIHVLVSIIIIFIVGALTSVHMRNGWRRPRQRWTGLSTLVILVLLTLTGVAILYVGSENAAWLASAIHIFLGVLVALFYWWHLRHRRFMELRVD